MPKILLVDDEDRFRADLAKRLRLRGYETIEAGNGEYAIKVARNDNEIGVVLLDLKMPGLSGEQTLAELKKYRPAVQVIMLTGHGSMASAMETGRLEAYAYLEKPCEMQKLLETITLLSERIGHEPVVRILPTLYDGRTRFARETLAEIRELFKDLCFDTVIRSNVRLREAARRGQPINRFAPSANGAVDYAGLATEVESAPPQQIERPVRPAREVEQANREIVIQFRNRDATDVRLAGDFNGWVPDKDVQSMVQTEGPQRIWTKILRLPPGTYEYRYVVDGEWCEDPDNPLAVPGPVGGRNSVLVVS
jgi:DNA-binding response OmpR family regulator